MASPTVRSTSTYASAASDTSFAFTLPAGWQAGDVIYIAVACRGATATSPTPAGWTAVAATFNAVGTTNTTLTVFRRVMQAGDGNPTITGASARFAVAAVALQGADGTTPEDGVAPSSAAQAAATNAPVANSVTPAGSDDLLLCFFGAGDPTTANLATTFTQPAGMTLAVQTATAQAGATDSAVCICTLALASNAATGTQTATVTPSSGSVAENSQAVTLVVKSGGPAPAAPEATADEIGIPPGFAHPVSLIHPAGAALRGLVIDTTPSGPAVPVYTGVHSPVWSNSNTSGAALAVTVAPTTIGDLMVVAVLNQGGTSVASLSGGGCSSWSPCGSPWTDPETPASVMEWWMGVVTSTGSSSLSVTWNAAVGAHFNEITAQDFHCSVPGTWTYEQVSNRTNASSGTVTYPAMTPSHGPEIACGYASTPSAVSVSAPLPSGAVAGLTSGLDCFIYHAAYSSGTIQHGVSLSEASWSIGVLFYMDTSGGAPTPVPVADAAAAEDTDATAWVITAAAQVNDAGAAAEQLASSSAVPVAETAGAADAVAVPARTLPLADAAAAAEATSAAAAAAVADTAGGSESVAAAVTVPQAEAAGAADQVSVSAGGITLPDAAGAAEALAVTVTVTNDASGGTNGVTLTQGSGGNTGGASGAYFDVITIGTGCGVAFDNSRGPLAVSFTTPAVAANALAAWTTSLFPSAAATQAWGRIQPYLTANPPTICRLLRFLSGATLRGSAGVNSSGKLVLIDAAGTTQATSVMTIPLNARFRLEVRLAGSATTGQIEAQLYVGANVDGTTPDETVITGSTINTGGTVSRLDFGNPSSSASYTITAWGFGGSTTTWLGPAPVGTVASLPDAAGAADQVAATAAAPLAEAAAGVEGLTVAATLAVADASGAADAYVASVTAQLPEVAAAAEAAAITATVPLAEQAAAVEFTPRELYEAAGAAESLASPAAVPLAEVAGASDQLAVSMPVSLAEVAGAAEALTAAVAVPLPEAGAGAEALPVAAVTGLADIAAGADAVSATVGTVVTLADAGGAAEALAVTVASPATDVAAAADGLGASAAVPVSDRAGAADAIAAVVGAAPQLTEAGAATDTAAVAAATGPGDTAGAAEAISIAGAALISLADAGAAADVLTVSTVLAPADAAAARDVLTTVQTAQPVLGDAAGVIEAYSASVATARGDVAAVSESLTVVPLLSIAVADRAAATEQILISIPPSVPVPAWEVGPLAPRWQLQAAEPGWEVDACRGGWETVLIPPRWEVSAAPARWRIAMAEFEPVASISKEAVPVLWTSDLGGAVTDPTTGPMPVQFAFPVSSGDQLHPAPPVTWFPGTWIAPVSGGYKGFIAECVIGPTSQGGLVQLAPGHYDVWSLVDTGQVTPRKFAGVLTVY